MNSNEYYPTWKHSPLERKKWTRMLRCFQTVRFFAVRLWITTSPYRWPIWSLPSTCMLCTPPVCSKDVYPPPPRRDQLLNLWGGTDTNATSCDKKPSETIEICDISSSHGGEYDVQNCLLKRRSTIILHGSISQKTILNIIEIWLR
jgi:hypothetical protein